MSQSTVDLHVSEGERYRILRNSLDAKDDDFYIYKKNISEIFSPLDIDKRD